MLDTLVQWVPLTKDAQVAPRNTLTIKFKKILKFLYCLNQELKLLLGALSLTKDFSEHFLNHIFNRKNKIKTF